MSYDRMPIVGAFYRPPAKLLLDCLAVGTPLQLIAEPENEYDVNAVAVWLKSENIPLAAHGTLEENLPQFGKTLEDVLGTPDWHLGYVPKGMAAELKAAGVIVDGTALNVKFGTNPKGDPRVVFDLPVL